jgi:mevalonate kinase
MQRYNSKLLLFGEYLIIRSGRALAVPYQKYGGSWQYKTGDLSAQQDLNEWAEYLAELRQEDKLLCKINIQSFRSDLQKGLYFESDIPVGYGLGSSGALCAALYDQYGIDKISKQAVHRFGELRKILAQLENFFHGSSSGIDPLICYAEQAVMIQEDGAMELVDLPPKNDGFHFFLLDTGTPRQTGPLVQFFLQQCKDPDYAAMVDGPLMTASANAVNHLIGNNVKGLTTSMQEISGLQYELLLKMIPQKFRSLWKEGVSTDKFSLKLCGAGGGGFILGFTTSMESLPEPPKGSNYQLLNF